MRHRHRPAGEHARPQRGEAAAYLRRHDRARHQRGVRRPLGRPHQLTQPPRHQAGRPGAQRGGWGRGRRFWVIDYVVLSGDPALPEVWAALTDLLNRPIVVTPLGVRLCRPSERVLELLR